jgi:hypothetical protein
MLTRIVSCDRPGVPDDDDAHDEIGLVDLAGHSFGITSDPLTQFAVIFSAVIHDGPSMFAKSNMCCSAQNLTYILCARPLCHTLSPAPIQLVSRPLQFITIGP